MWTVFVCWPSFSGNVNFGFYVLLLLIMLYNSNVVKKVVSILCINNRW